MHWGRFFSLIMVSLGAAQAAPAAVSYIQGNSAVPQTPQWSVSATYAAAQTAGNVNVVAIGWYNTSAHVLSVTDTAGNIYKLSVGPTKQAQAGTQAIYYAPIVAGSTANNNRVVVSFDAAVPYPDLRIAEYSGVAATNPVDGVAASAGSGTNSSSGSLTTTNANDLLIGANYVTTGTTGPGPGYTARKITYPDGSILEDAVVTSVGGYAATAPIAPSGGWIMQLLALRAAGSTTTAPPPASSSIGFVQRSYAVPQSPQAVVSATFSGAQTAGNLNVVVVGWNDSTAHLQSVKDTRGNVYNLAVGPTVNAGNATQAIYYAFNATSSAANSNTVTATFNTPAAYVDMRIAEYRGISASNPLDVVAAGSGTSSMASTNAVTTTGSNDLIVAANTVATGNAAAGTGYTTRVITNPDSDLLEDRTVTAGNYSATAPLVSSGAWVMQMVAFRGGSAAASTQPIVVTNTPPTISGTPATSVLAGSAYLFLPTASDANNDPLIFSVSNLPSWATFNTATGQLSGTPGVGAVGNYANIVISVSDGKATVSLPAFAISVTQTGAGGATVSWLPPTQATDGSSIVNLAGYKIYYGTNAGALNQVVQLANPGATSYVLSNLSSGTYYFAVTAYTSAGTESALSGVASKVIP